MTSAYSFFKNLMAPEGANGNRIEQAVDGIQTLKAGRPMKVIVLSAHCPDAEFADRVRRAGADHFLLLPLNAVELEKDVALCVGPLTGQPGAG